MGHGSDRPRRGAPKGQGLTRAPCMMLRSVPPRLSRGESKEDSHLLPWRSPSQTLAWSVVEKRIDSFELCPANVRERRLFGVESADQTVDVFIRAAFPGMIGPCEIHVHVGCSRHLLVPGKLFAVVERETQQNRLWQCAKQGADSARDLVGFLTVRTPDQCEPRISLDQGDQVSSLMGAIDQVAFPMPDRLARLHLGRTGIDSALIGNPPSSAPVWTRTAPSPLTSGTWKIRPKRSSGLGIGVNVRVDRLLAHPGSPLQSSSVAYDIRRPPVLESRLGVEPDGFGETSRTCSLGLLCRHPVGLLRAVATPARVPLDLTDDAACRTPQPAAHLSQSKPFLTPTVNALTLFFGHAFVRQYRSPRVVTKNVAYRVTFSYTGVAIAARAREDKDPWEMCIFCGLCVPWRQNGFTQ